MTCRHLPGDPNCGSYERSLLAEERRRKEKEKEYSIEDVEVRGPFLLLRVKYPYCANCAYDNDKLLIFKATALEAMKWREIDPHFRDKPAGPRAAPSPIARFPASKEGREHARQFLQLLSPEPSPFHFG